MTRTRGRWVPKRGRPGGVKNQDLFEKFCLFLTFWAAKVPALAQTRPSLSPRHTATHPKDCTGLGDPNTLKLYHTRKFPRALDDRLPPKQGSDPAQILTQSISNPSQHLTFQV